MRRFKIELREVDASFPFAEEGFVPEGHEHFGERKWELRILDCERQMRCTLVSPIGGIECVPDLWDGAGKKLQAYLQAHDKREVEKANDKG